MFFEDEIYANFLSDMRNLLKDDKAFKDRYCSANNVADRSKKNHKFRWLQNLYIRKITKLSIK